MSSRAAPVPMICVDRSEIRTDLDMLLSGRAAPRIREILVRGLDISDEQQVAIAKTLGSIVANEGEEGIYEISLDQKLSETIPAGEEPLQ